MTAYSHVVILVASPVQPSHLINSALGDVPLVEAFQSALRKDVSISVVSWAAWRSPLPEGMHSISLSGHRTPLLDRLLELAGAFWLRKRLSTSPVGRLLNSIGPTDQSRVFFRAIRATQEARATIDSAELLVAADLPATRTAWVAVHKGSVPAAFYGISAALSEIARSDSEWHPQAN